MSQGESLIVLLLAVIAYFLYQIGRQLTFLTGRKMRSPFSNLFSSYKHRKTQPKTTPKEEKLPN